MVFGDRGNVTADCGQRRMPQNLCGVGAGDPVPTEDLTRQVEPAPVSVLDKVAKNVGQLESPAE